MLEALLAVACVVIIIMGWDIVLALVGLSIRIIHVLALIVGFIIGSFLAFAAVIVTLHYLFSLF